MENEALTVNDYLQIIRRRKWSLIIPTLLSIIAAGLLALHLPPVYRSAATILIEEQEIPPDFVIATVTGFAEQRLQQIYQRIMSTSRLLEIIKTHDLYKKMRKISTSEEVIEKMRDDVTLRQISADVVDRRTGRPTTATIAFSLSYEGKESPEKVQRVANVLASLFLQENLQVRERQTAETSNFLEEEMQRAKKELATVEAALATFKEKYINELPELLQVNIQGLSAIEQKIERLEEQLRSFKEKQGYLQTQLANISPFLGNTDRDRLQLAKTELAALRSRFSDVHPDVVKLKGEIAALTKKLNKNNVKKYVRPKEPDNPAYVTLASQLASTKTEIVSISNQIKVLNNTKTKYEARIETTPRVERNYMTLIAEQANLKSKYNDLMRKFMEAKVAQGLEKEQKGERFTLIDPPRLPEKPFRPNRPAIIMIGLVMGISMGIGWTALREYTDTTIRSSYKLALSTGFPVLGVIPAIITAKDRRRTRLKKVISFAMVCILIGVGVVAFHLWVMDLNILWAKLSRRMML